MGNKLATSVDGVIDQFKHDCLSQVFIISITTSVVGALAESSEGTDCGINEHRLDDQVGSHFIPHHKFKQQCKAFLLPSLR
jgi:hypothetical protein